MTDILATLQPLFAAKVRTGLAALAAGGLHFQPYFGRRDPVAQAKLWRQSRPLATIQAQIADLQTKGCDFIAQCLIEAGPQSGAWATNALPGLSWHQYGLAVDCYLVGDDGHPDWDSPDAYRTYGQVADAHDMYWGGHFHDNDHWQNSQLEPIDHLEPIDCYGSLAQIDVILRAEWSDLNTKQDYDPWMLHKPPA